MSQTNTYFDDIMNLMKSPAVTVGGPPLVRSHSMAVTVA